jgi:hypothetical protein
VEGGEADVRAAQGQAEGEAVGADGWRRRVMRRRRPWLKGGEGLGAFAPSFPTLLCMTGCETPGA